MSGSESEKYFKAYERDFFDIVIIDECHRGGANDESSWRGILEHFDAAVHLGLTATPKRTDNANTYEYFGEPVFVYSLKEGIQDGFLTPFKVKRIQTTIDEYVYTQDDEVLEGDVEEGYVYKESDFNRKIVIEERERMRVKELLQAINQNEKTIVFCANQAHAALVRDLINQESESKRVDYCVRVTANDGAIGDNYLKQFQDNEKSIPTILTTSQKLTTGVDARNVRNVVLMRPINSMIEFKQIIGRGTRLFEGKHYFTIVDFVNAYHLFSDPDWDGDAVSVEYEKEGRKEGKVSEEEALNREEKNEQNDEEQAKPKIRVKLSDGKVRELQSMKSTYFYVDGKPISAEEFLKRLFDTIKLPEILGSEEQLRKVWSNPITRRELIQKLEKAGCYKDDLLKLQELISAENSDLFDVLEYIAYLKSPLADKQELRLQKVTSLICSMKSSVNLFAMCSETTLLRVWMSLISESSQQCLKQSMAAFTQRKRRLVEFRTYKRHSLNFSSICIRKLAEKMEILLTKES
jgi:type I restriction enzyme, R subunit